MCRSSCNDNLTSSKPYILFGQSRDINSCNEEKKLLSCARLDITLLFLMKKQKTLRDLETKKLPAEWILSVQEFVNCKSFRIDKKR